MARTPVRHLQECQSIDNCEQYVDTLISPARCKHDKSAGAADVEEWSWIERRKDTVQLNSSKHSLQDLSSFAREGRRGVCAGACVFRHRDQLWLPLTEVCSP